MNRIFRIVMVISASVGDRPHRDDR